MRWVTAHGKALQIQDRTAPCIRRESKGFNDWITCRAVHELLFESGSDALPLLPALQAIRGAISGTDGVRRSPGALVWVDPDATFYPPAVMGLGVSPRQLHLLRPDPANVLWATIECLRCPSVGAVVAHLPQRLTRVDVRRLQLAAEHGGGIGLLLRPHSSNGIADIYAAATRWIVAPAPGERTVQRWRLQLVHGHGGQVGHSFLLEKRRGSAETNFVPLSAPLVHHPSLSAAS